MTGAVGTTITGVNNNDGTGATVANAGDINGDGYDDVLIGAPGSPQAYLLFGKDGGLGSTVDPSTLDGTIGFTITTGETGNLFSTSVEGLGDINGDGFDDIIINAASADTPAGTSSGAAYVVFGKSTGFAASINVDNLNGTDGFRLQGPEADSLVNAVAGAGDINGDGFDDIIVGSALDGSTNNGSAFVVFGSDSGFAADISLGALASDQGFEIAGAADSDGLGLTVNSAGDINGDGFDDLMVGSSDYSSAGAGNAFVVYGRDFFNDVAATGTSDGEHLVGTSGEDEIVGAGGADVIHAGAGDDRVVVADSTFEHLDGGGGKDTLVLDSAFNIDLTAMANDVINGFEHIDLNNGLANTLDIDFSSVLDIGEAIDHLIGETNMLVVSGDSSDTVNLAGNWTQRTEQPDGASSQGYTVFDSDDSEASVALQNTIQNINNGTA